jgi:hypothetical protein
MQSGFFPVLACRGAAPEDPSYRLGCGVKPRMNLLLVFFSKEKEKKENSRTEKEEERT